MRSHVTDSVVGAVVLAVAIGFAVFTYRTTGMGVVSDDYTLSARFDTAAGLHVGSEVRISGIKVGQVTAVTLDPKTFMAQVQLSLPKTVAVPADSVAQIMSEGLLGGYHLAIQPGGDDKTLPAGGTIRFTQPAVDFMQLLGKFIFSAGEQKPPAGAAPPK